ncbi:MAG: hypothetical protein NC218_03510 [Acetobacter sp.]|nr:hypothetical protein [Acetobacter sp.]
MLELAGFIATTLVFISFLFTNVKWIRWLNLIGSIFFVIYGFGIGAFWTGLMNAGLIGVQLYHLYKIYKPNKGARNARKN